MRGELVSSHGCGQLQSSSDSNLHTFLDRDDDEPRLKTAVCTLHFCTFFIQSLIFVACIIYEQYHTKIDVNSCIIFCTFDYL